MKQNFSSRTLLKTRGTLPACGLRMLCLQNSTASPSSHVCLSVPGQIDIYTPNCKQYWSLNFLEGRINRWPREPFKSTNQTRLEAARRSPGVLEGVASSYERKRATKTVCLFVCILHCWSLVQLRPPLGRVRSILSIPGASLIRKRKKIKRNRKQKYPQRGSN